jgi:hypothetical protein
MMKDAYAPKLATFIEFIEHKLIHDNGVARFPVSA